MTYIVHFCNNKNCNNGWIDEDVKRSNAPPTWKKCRTCAGSSFDKQVPTVDKELSERMKAASKAKQLSKTA